MADMKILRQWRELAGLTQKELAQKTGVGYGTIQRCEYGKEIRLALIQKIAIYFGVTIGEFLAGPSAKKDAEFVYIPYLNAADHPVGGDEVRIPHFSTRAGAGNGWLTAKIIEDAPVSCLNQTGYVKESDPHVP